MSSAPRFVLREFNYDSLYREIKNIASKLLPDWNFDDPNDLGRFLIEAGISLAEMNNYASNSWANETFIQTARDKVNIHLHAQVRNYLPQTAQPSIIEKCVIQLDQVTTSDINIPAYSLKASVTDDNYTTVIYENRDDILIPAGNLYSPNFVLIEGESISEQYTYAGLDFDYIEIPKTSVILLTSEVNKGLNIRVGDSPAIWNYVPDFLYSLPTDKHFTLRTTKEGYLRIYFGNDSKGEKPVSLSKVYISYRQGGGIHSISANSSFDILDNLNLQSVRLITKISNSTRSTLGKNSESLDSIRTSVMLLGSERSRLSDLQALSYYVNSLSGVQRSRVAIDSQDIKVSIIPHGGGTASDELLTTINKSLINKIALGYSLVIESAKYREVSTKIKVYTENPRTEIVYRAVRTVLRKLLDPLAREEGNYINEFGTEFKLAELGYALKSVPDIYDYTIEYPVENIILADYEIITSGLTLPRLVIDSHNSGDIYLDVVSTASQFSNFKFKLDTTGDSLYISSSLVANNEGTLYTIYLGQQEDDTSLKSLIEFINNDSKLYISKGSSVGTFTAYEDTRILHASTDSLDIDTIMPTLTYAEGEEVEFDNIGANYNDIEIIVK